MATVRMHRDPALGEPHTADVHPSEVDRWQARGWIQGDAPPILDPAANPSYQTITGLINTAWNPADVQADRAATEGQLAALALGGGAAVDLSGFAKKAELATVATSGNYRDLRDPPDIPAAYDDSGLVARVAALEAAPNVDARVFVATYNVTPAQEIIAYLDSANEPFAPVIVKRGNDYYTAALATKSGDDGVIVRVLGSGSGDYIVFNYTVRGNAWSNSSYTFQKKLVSGTDIKTINGESLLGSGDIAISGGSADKREYLLCVADTGGNVVQIGEIKIDGTDYGVFEFYYKTDALPSVAAKTFSLANLLADYTIKDFIDATGITSNGVFIGNGRTDNDNRLIVQQFSKNNKNFQIRTYLDFSAQTATVKIQFIGSRNA